MLDSWGKPEAAHNDCGGIYQRWDEARDPKGFDGVPPRVNAARKPGRWQSFDIVFRAPRFDESGAKVEDARFVSVHHNGVLVHEDVAVGGPTATTYWRNGWPLLRAPLSLSDTRQVFSRLRLSAQAGVQYAAGSDGHQRDMAF